MHDVRQIYEELTRQAPSPPDALERQHQRQRRRTMTRKLGALAAVVVIVSAGAIAVGLGPRGGSGQPGSTGPTGPAEPTVTVPTVSPPVTTAPYYRPDIRSEVDYVIDLNTGRMTALPKAIVGALGEAAEPWFALERYAASSGGSMLAFVGAGEDGTPQIFIAGIDGTGVRQVTHDPTRAMSPAWSPDGTLIAYMGYGEGEIPNLFLLDLASGVATQITDESFEGGWNPTFSPDGRSLVYTGNSSPRTPELRTVPVEGGESTPLVRPGEGIDDSGNGAISPDGSLVTFLGGGWPEFGEVTHCGPCRLVANADGTGRRVIPGWMGTPAGMWSPDGSRIVTMDVARAYEDLPPTDEHFILVVDVATAEATIVANGRAAIWLDDQTLLVVV
ncbi:MAG TPA: hypothetical protein VE669_02815 [Actinomycetota bacterium]|nr:hypothetical protein [Actinomycetota bacterium]